MIRLGIDTGGTYTDAVVIDMQGGVPQVLAKAKALTTKSNLTRGIGQAMDALPADILARCEHAALSTTLATNACVEDKGGRARLIIVGTTDEVLRRVDAQRKFGIPYSDVLAVEYKGSYDGSDVVIPDWEALYERNPSFFNEADSFGIASLYALNNGAVVEKSGAAYLREKFGKLVVEATTVAAEPNVIGRGATALLNARLVPVIEEFLNAIYDALAQRGLDIPVSIVRSDGTLMSAELARTRPVETILSGPAASVTGAQALAGASESLIVDIGGTTSDISIVHGGRPNRTDGIYIGRWKTQVSGVYIDTISLGGDTAVRYTKNSRLELMNRKVTPLCIAAARWPRIKENLKSYLAQKGIDFHSRYELFYLLRDPGDRERFTDPERKLLEVLRDGPMPLYDERMNILGLKTQRLEDEGIVMRCGMTPTDAMHLKGEFDAFDVEASRLGAECVLKSYLRPVDPATDEEVLALADEIYDLARFRLFRQVVGAFAQDRYWPDASARLDGQMERIVRGIWDQRDQRRDHPFDIRAHCDATLVGVGAPTHVFIREVADLLGAPCAVPESAEVANAVGAAASRVSVEQAVHVSPVRGSDGVVQVYQVRGLNSSEGFNTLPEALEAARITAREDAIAEARRRGAEGDLDCELIEGCSMYEAMGVMDIVRDWVITARIGYGYDE